LESLPAQAVVFTINGTDLESVDQFVYLRKLVTVNDSDLPVVIRTLHCARAHWAQVSRILLREGATPKILAKSYKAVVQSVLLFSCETWVISRPSMGLLEGFHHTIARRLTGWTCCPGRTDEASWIYPAMGKTLDEAGMHSMATYIGNHHRYILSWALSRPDFATYATLPGGGAGGPQCKYWWTDVQLQ
jgi:hypothetical protein